MNYYIINIYGQKIKLKNVLVFSEAKYLLIYNT